MKLTQFFKEDNGTFSSARLLAFFSVCSFIIDWQKHLWSGMSFDPSWTLVGFVLGVCGFKMAQKFAEDKNDNVTIIKTTEKAGEY